MPPRVLPHREQEPVLVRGGPEQRDALAGDVDEEGGGIVAEVEPKGLGREVVEPREVAEQLLCEFVG